VRAFHLSLIALLTLDLVGCSDCESDATTEQPPESETGGAETGESAERPEGPQSDTPIAEQMAEHFTKVLDARAAIIRGDLDAAKVAGQALADEEPTANIPDNWAPHVTALRETARTLAGAQDLDAAALAVGKLGVACGSCHAAVGATIELADAPAPTGDDVATHMLRHQWGADRLWEGLTGPADDRWSGGAGALVEAPLHPSAIAANQTVPPEIAAIGEQVHTLGRNAQQAENADQRAQFYGELLVTCAACHTKLEGAPGH
jgi:hypothetical protein